MPKPKLSPEALTRAAQLREAGETHNSIRDILLDEFGVNVARSSLIEALQRHGEAQKREEAVKRVEAHEAKLSADAARAVAATVAAEDLPADAKLIQLRLAALVGRSNGAWEGMSAKEKTSF